MAVLDKKRERLIKKILTPVLGVGRGYEPCKLCGEETTWTVNNHRVCPRCTVELGLAKKDHVPDLCEICGKQGEFVCGEPELHSLCCRHRDEWFRFPKFELGGLKGEAPEFDDAWDKCFSRFVSTLKGEKTSV